VTSPLQTPADRHYQTGRRDGLALGALALALVAFVNVLSLEKALLAAGLAVLALKAAPGAPANRKAQWALGIALFYIVSWAAFLVIFHDKLARLIQLMQQLG
jgi:hypothetical protein